MTNTNKTAAALANLFPQWDSIDGIVPAEVVAARDAALEGRADAYTMLVGLPATIGAGADSYAATVVRATPCTVTVAYASDGEERTFRFSKRGWRSRGRTLSVGTARNYWSPEV